MKTIAEMQQLMNDIDHLQLIGRGNNDKVWSCKAARERRFYYKVRLYLETSPREAFLKKQLAKTIEYIEVTEQRGTAELMGRIYPQLNYRQARAKWRKDNNVPHWQQQKKVIEFILN